MTTSLKPDEMQAISSVVGSVQQNAKAPKAEQECGSSVMQQLTPCQIQTLAQKVYALLLDELRIEAERHGRVFMH